MNTHQNMTCNRQSGITRYIASVAFGITLAAAAVVVAPADAQAGDTSVRGYFRANGTYVRPHYRSTPDGNPYNNYSFPGNTNPWTGKAATGNPSTYLNNYYKGRGGVYGNAVPTYRPTRLPSTQSPSYALPRLPRMPRLPKLSSYGLDSGW